MIRKKKRMHDQAKKTNKWKNYRFFQKECRREMRKLETVYVNSNIEQGLKENNQKSFWRCVKLRRQDSSWTIS